MPDYILKRNAGFIGRNGLLLRSRHVIIPPANSYNYNWHAINDPRFIAASNWQVPTEDNFASLVSYLGGSVASLTKLKSNISGVWATPGTNSSGFNGLPKGQIAYNPAMSYGDGSFLTLWSSTEKSSTQAFHFGIQNDSVWTESTYKYIGSSVRLVKISTSLTNGQTGTYLGNDGKTYNTICIGTQEWLSESLEETQFRNKDFIHEETNASVWATIGSQAYAEYGKYF